MAQKTKVKAKAVGNTAAASAKSTATREAASTKTATTSKSKVPVATKNAAAKPATDQSSVASKAGAVKAKAPRKAAGAAGVAAKPAAKPARKAAAAARKPAAPKKSAPVGTAAGEKPTKVKASIAKPVLAKKSAANASEAKAVATKKPAAVKKPAAKKAVASTIAPAMTGMLTGAAATAKKLGSTPTRAVAASIAQAAQSKISAPVAKSPASPKEIAAKAAASRQVANASKKPISQRHGFKTNEFVVYPAHGVGRIVGIEEQEIAGIALELFVITFDKEKLTLRVPTGKLESVGMRKLADEAIVKRAMEILKGRARVKRTMWSRRAQEYVAKINSGDLISIAEVVRDLYRSEAQPEQSYSERQLYEDALDRMAREVAAVDKLDDRGAVQRITEVLSKSARGRRLAEEADDAGSETQAA